MVGQLGGDFRGYALLAGMDGTDCVEEISMHLAFQYIGPGTRFKSAQYLDITLVRGQDDDSGIGEFGSNADHGFNAVQSRHLKIHKSYIRPVRSELFDSFLSVAGFTDQLHVGFSVDQCCDPLAEERMVVDGEDPNRASIATHAFAALLRKSLNPEPTPDVPYATAAGTI